MEAIHYHKNEEMKRMVGLYKAQTVDVTSMINLVLPHDQLFNDAKKSLWPYLKAVVFYQEN